MHVHPVAERGLACFEALNTGFEWFGSKGCIFQEFLEHLEPKHQALSCLQAARAKQSGADALKPALQILLEHRNASQTHRRPGRAQQRLRDGLLVFAHSGSRCGSRDCCRGRDVNWLT